MPVAIGMLRAMADGDVSRPVFWADQIAMELAASTAAPATDGIAEHPADGRDDPASAGGAGPAQVMNDSKTPSGRAHVGALRGVLVHDAVLRSCRAAGMAATYRFGSDDMDPLDELSPGLEDHLRPHLGKPLHAVPAPPGVDAPDLATWFIDELFGVFEPLGVGAVTYRMRDVYRSGQFDDAIDAIVRHAGAVREVYRRVSGSQRPDDWLPLQVVCERCGRIGTTSVSDYDGETVAYQCRRDLVAWAEGCGASGRVSPFGGRAKLPWKLEWVAKWHVFGVTVEGAGKDHTTRGGSREVAAACLEAVFDEVAPRNVPYEFFLVGGRKMSSSRGRGVALGDMARLVPPDLLRFVMLRVPPRRAVDFEPDLATVSRLFDDYDRLVNKVASGACTPADVALYETARAHPAERGPLGGSSVRPAPVSRSLPPFDTVVSVLQLPHLDTVAALERGIGRQLSAGERSVLDERMASARTWLEVFADPAERIELQHAVPASAEALDQRQRAYLHVLADLLEDCPWQGTAVQAALFDAARCTPIAPREGFSAVYQVFLGRRDGPRAGYLLAFLDRAQVLARLRALPYDAAGLWQATACTSISEAVDWVAEAVPGAAAPATAPAEVVLRPVAIDGVGVSGTGMSGGAAQAPGSPASVAAAGVELDVLDSQGRRHRARLALGGPGAAGSRQQVAVAEQVAAALTEAGYEVRSAPRAAPGHSAAPGGRARRASAG